MRKAITLLVFLLFPMSAVAQQPRRDFLPEFQRDQLVHERALRRAAAREQRVYGQCQYRRGQRVEWYMGADGFWVRSY